MTHKDFIKLLNKGVITHTGFVDSNGDINTEEDLDVLASQLITQTGITDGKEEGTQLQEWINTHYPDTESETPEVIKPELNKPTLSAAKVTSNPASIIITANDYAGTHVVLMAESANATILFGTAKTSIDKEELAIKALKNKTVYMTVTPNEGQTSGSIALKLIDKDNTETILATVNTEFENLASATEA